MSVVGVTGGIGMGKTFLSDLLEKFGFPVLDADVLARELTKTGGEALPGIVQIFGSSVLDAEGGLDRRQVAEIVFKNSDKRKQLERVLHPRVRLLWKNRVAPFRSQEAGPIFVVIPLLYEVSAEDELDFIVCVACRREEQRERLAIRGWSEDHIQQRLKAQWSIDRKMRLADMVVWTSCSFETTVRQAECLAENVVRLASSK